MSLGERADLRGAVIEGKYRLGERIGIGGTGVVFCDGHTRFLSEKIAPWVYGQMLTSNKRVRSFRAQDWERYMKGSELVPYIFDENDINK